MADFIGVSDIHFWRVTEDSDTSYTAGEVKVLSRTGTISQTTEQSQSTKYYSNVPAYAVNSKGATTITAEVEGLALEVLAELHGTTIDPDTGALIDDGEAKNLAFGISFRADFVGEAGSRYYSFPNVVISIPDEGTKTKDDSTDTLNQSLTITAISTRHKFTATGKPCKVIEIDTDGNDNVNFANWFKQAVTPDSLEELKAA